MHEFSIVQALVEQVEREVAAADASGRITRLELSIGRLSGVHCDSIRFAFEVLAPDTIMAGAELVIDEPRAECVCRECHVRSPLEEFISACPACDSPDITIEGGREMLLQSIELE